MISLKKVSSEEVYETIHSFITKREILVEDYDGMIEVILSMIKDGYCFVMDRDLLRDAMESLTYMYSPSDDMNRDRLVNQFADEEEDDDDEEEEEEFGNMDLMKMMQMMGAPPQRSEGSVTEGSVTEGSVTEEPVTEEPVTEEPKKIVTEESVVPTEETTVVKEGGESQ